MSYRMPATTLRAVVLADTELQPVYRWEGGRRTDQQLTDDQGRSLFRATQVPAVFQGQADVLSLVSYQPVVLPAGSIVGVDTTGDSWAELRGVSGEGTRFVEQRLTVTAEGFTVLADISELLD